MLCCTCFHPFVHDTSIKLTPAHAELWFGLIPKCRARHDPLRGGTQSEAIDLHAEMDGDRAHHRSLLSVFLLLMYLSGDAHDVYFVLDDVFA